MASRAAPNSSGCDAGAPDRWWVWIPIEQSAWCPAEVAKVRVAASGQNTHPAGTVPSNSGTPSGTVSGKAIAMGGRDSSSASVSRSAWPWRS